MTCRETPPTAATIRAASGWTSPGDRGRPPTRLDRWCRGQITLPLAPLVAVSASPCRSFGPRVSHTAGTLDSSTSVAGWQASLSNEAMMQQAEDVGAVIRAAGRPRRPTRELYALRDVTGTVEGDSPLIAELIMSKKIAEAPARWCSTLGRQRRVHEDPRERHRAGPTMVDLGTDVASRLSALIDRHVDAARPDAGRPRACASRLEVSPRWAGARRRADRAPPPRKMLDAAGRGGRLAVVLATVARRTPGATTAAQGGDPDVLLPVATERHEGAGTRACHRARRVRGAWPPAPAQAGPQGGPGAGRRDPDARQPADPAREG